MILCTRTQAVPFHIVSHFALKNCFQLILSSRFFRCDKEKGKQRHSQKWCCLHANSMQSWSYCSYQVNFNDMKKNGFDKTMSAQSSRLSGVICIAHSLFVQILLLLFLFCLHRAHFRHHQHQHHHHLIIFSPLKH